MTAILPKELLTATLGGLSLLVVSGGSDGDVLVQQSDGTYAPETLVTGDVFGPASSTDNAIARFDATTGKLLQNCVVTIGDTGNIAGLGTVSCGAITTTGNITLAASQQLFVSNGATTGNYLLSGATAVFANNSVAQGGWNTNGMYVRRLFIDYANADICLARVSTSNLGVYAGDGTTPAALTCGAITASGTVNIQTSSDSATAFRVRNAAGVAIAQVDTSGRNFIAGGDAFAVRTGTGGTYLFNGGFLAVTNSTDASSATADTFLSRASAGVWRFGTTSTGATAGIQCGAITASGLVCMSIYTVATLPSASANAYKEANVSDALAPAMGVAVVGGGSVKTKVRSNGTDWTVCGI